MRVFVGWGIGDRVDSVVLMRGKCERLFAGMFRSKVPFFAPLSPGHIERSSFETSILLNRSIVPKSLGEAVSQLAEEGAKRDKQPDSKALDCARLGE